tara:strand:+ start:908 stop:2845 length:1938 start_codon:yes stop_codon:yes gene_type:complete
MSWQILLKAQPASNITLLIALADDSKTDSLIEEIQESEQLTASFKGIINNIKANNITVDSMLKKLPLPNVSKEKIEENLKKLLSSIKPEQMRETKQLETLVDEAISAKKEGDDTKFAELSQKINEVRSKSTRSYEANTKLRAKLRVFDSFGDGFALKFNAVPKSGAKKQKFQNTIENFANEIGASVVGDTIQTNFPNATAFLNSLGQDTAEIRREMAEYEPDLESSGRRLAAVSETDTMVASGVKFDAKETLTSVDVENYLIALEDIPGSVGKFIPTEMKNGFDFPADAIFLERESKTTKSLSLNPYGRLLIMGTFGGDNWFKQFFDAVRTNAFVSEKIAERILIESIINGLEDNSNPARSSLGTNLVPFRDLQLTGNMKAKRKKVREFIKNDTNLNTAFSQEATAYQSNIFQDKYQDKFTIKETDAFQEVYDSTEDADFVFGDLNIEYYDNTDTLIENKSGASYAKIFLDDSQVSPSELIQDIESKQKEKGVEVTLGRLRQSMLNTGDFAQFIVDYSNDSKLEPLTKESAAKAATFDKLSPKNSLIVLSRLGEQGILDTGTDGLIADTFISIDNNRGNTSKQLELANELNDKMIPFLKEAKIQLISGFQLRLEDFGKNYEKYFPRKQSNVPIAVKAFKDKQLIR